MSSSNTASFIIRPVSFVAISLVHLAGIIIFDPIFCPNHAPHQLKVELAIMKCLHLDMAIIVSGDFMFCDDTKTLESNNSKCSLHHDISSEKIKKRGSVFRLCEIFLMASV